MNTELTKQTQIDDINLVELIKALWDKKWWIVLSTFICTAIAGVYAFTAKEQWTSKAEIVAPRVGELGYYFSIRKEYARVLHTDFNVEHLINSLYGKFDQLAYSLDEREKFLENSELFQQLSEDLDVAGKRKLLNILARDNIHIIKPDAKKDPDAIGKRFSFSAQTPELAQKTLKQFVDFINQTAFKLDYDEFVMYANEKLVDLDLEYNTIKNNLDINKKVQLEYLNKALSTAEKAGIKEYSKLVFEADNLIDNREIKVASSDARVQLSESKLSDGTYVFMLGEKYLKAQIDANNEKGIIYPPRYYQIEEQINKIKNILEKAKKINDMHTFSYLSSPDYPVNKDKPKKGLILFIGFMLGLIFSILIILLIKAVKK